MTTVELLDIHKSFGHLEVLKGVNLSVADGEVVCILGPSGSGKSTLLRCVNALQIPDSGYVLVDDELIGRTVRGNKLHSCRPSVLRRQRRGIGMVFQHFALFPHLTVLENLILAPSESRLLSTAAAKTRAQELLKRVGLSEKKQHYPRQLSGGQQQRVAIARALMMDPGLILFDEPTSALDPELVGEVLAVLRGLADSGTTMIIVTHEIGFARDVADRVVLMADGVVVEEGTPSQVLDAPKNPRTRSFLGHLA